MRQHLDMRIETAAIYCLFTVLSQKWNDLWNGVLLIAYNPAALYVKKMSLKERTYAV